MTSPLATQVAFALSLRALFTAGFDLCGVLNIGSHLASATAASGSSSTPPAAYSNPKPSSTSPTLAWPGTISSSASSSSRSRSRPLTSPVRRAGWGAAGAPSASLALLAVVTRQGNPDVLSQPPLTARTSAVVLLASPELPSLATSHLPNFVTRLIANLPLTTPLIHPLQFLSTLRRRQHPSERCPLPKAALAPAVLHVRPAGQRCEAPTPPSRQRNFTTNSHALSAQGSSQGFTGAKCARSSPPIPGASAPADDALCDASLATFRLWGRFERKSGRTRG
ncbi:hypothetical protein BDV96DRAFT_602733 [Lophiotrema nucula]|uniref:Uncharacterized protein n=1 Tax=Lophiotrema nucula TaxID=690887 RepID=A0A6A5YWV1_9PLEO|nr:hypothetical protein BDV96DRAFT_602733 [Lophiotrema nucula]